MKRRGRVCCAAFLALFSSFPAFAQMGTRWKQATASASWTPRTRAGAVVFGGKMWVLGGYSAAGNLNDIWHSTNGETWTSETLTAPWYNRNGHTSVVHNGEMWVLGGRFTPSLLSNDVWHSPDGANWTEALHIADAPWEARERHASVAHNGEIWVLGGRGEFGVLLNDVWRSTDGTKFTWAEATSSAPWDARWGLSAVVFNGEIWVLGGYTGGFTNDVWHSPDGANWTQATPSAPWSPRAGLSPVVCDGKIWVTGGNGGTDVYFNDVWCSSDGANWAQATAGAPWTPRFGHRSVVFNYKIWVLGGGAGTGNLWNDVWHSGAPSAAQRWQRY